MDITSFVLGLRIGKNSSGGSSADVRYVTFMNGDEVLYVKPVAVGDDCVDVFTKGLISKPTKESTVQFDYSYSGWSITNDNTVDSNALEAVTEDRTVYACYDSSVRKYTITYYDGDTVLKTEQLEYGSMPAYIPEKDGFSFDSWSPTLARVTGNASYVAQWGEKVTFAGGAWKDIVKVTKAGEAEQYFAVGDTRKETIGDKSYNFIILGFNHDDLADGSGKANMTILIKEAFADTFSVDNWTTLSSNMSTTLLPQLPTELQSAIVSVTKKCDVATRNTVVTPIDVDFTLFPLSFSECKIESQGTKRKTDTDWEISYTELGEPYQYFINKYNASKFGPYYLLPNGLLYRQYSRASSPVTGLITTNSHYTSSKIFTYSSGVTITAKHPVTTAFCI
jgi:hypothetical protein